jgi:Protein of unknown function (DUF1569)
MSTSTSTGVNRINTAKVQGRRTLRFETLDEIYADASQLADTRNLRQLGNWSLGQATSHLARSMKMSLEGADRMAPIWLRLFLKPFKRYVLTKGLRPGFSLRGHEAEMLVPGSGLSTEEGLAALSTYIERLKTEPQRFPHPAFGAMTREQWDQLHKRHAELHLSFFVLQ